MVESVLVLCTCLVWNSSYSSSKLLTTLIYVSNKLGGYWIDIRHPVPSWIIYFTAHTIKCVCHSIRSMFGVLGLYNFGITPQKNQEFPKHSRITKKFPRFWKYPISYIALGGQKPFRACWYPLCIFLYRLFSDTPRFSDSFLTDQMCH